mgnify:CR=1 FL=1
MKNWIGIFIMLAALIFLLVNIDKKDDSEEAVEIIKEPEYEYGILVDSFNLKRGEVMQNQVLGEILYLHHINHQKIDEIVNKSKGIFDFRKATPGNKFMVLCAKDSNETAKYFIYEETSVDYIVFDLRNNIDVYRGKKQINIKKRTIKGKINSSLWNALIEAKSSPALVMKLEEIYAWTIDFFKIQKDDRFTIYYEEKYVDDEFIGIGRVIASEFVHKNKKLFAFYFEENENFGDYFDEKGNTLRKTFLSAPLKYSRISSRYSKNRKHPVTGQWKGHFGTDYAAPKGTPIFTTANGVITTASYTKNNGNYVKVRHNSKYTTQYLHMSKIKPGIRKGVYVKQGEVIGYVGSTGLATGPHVCYRFWRDGKQVDPYKEKLPPGDPIKKENKKKYTIVKDSLMQYLTESNH